MYIMKCDRCGAEQKIKSILPIFGAKEEAPTPGRKFSLMQLDEFREITLCQACDAALEEWITRKGCYNCKHNETNAGVEPCASCDTRSKNHWEAK